MLRHILMLLLLTVSCLEATDVNIVKSNQTQEFTNLQVHNNTFYVGANNSILMYNGNLTFKGAISTCGRSNELCGNNLNKVLVISKEDQQLIFCGNGMCESRNLTDLNKTNQNDYLQVSSDTNRPAKAFLTMDGVLIIAVTYSSKLPTVQVAAGGKSYNYPISFRNLNLAIKQPYSLGVESVLPLNLSGSPENYIIYYKGVSHVNNSSYFITNQKEYIGGSKYISKLAQVNCFNTKTYADIEISCSSEDKTYNLVQDFVLIPSGNETYAVFAFSEGKHPEHPEENSALCVTKLSVLDSNILDAKLNFTNFCNQSVEKQQLEKRYLANYRFSEEGSKYSCVGEHQPSDLAECMYSETARYTIGDRQLKMTSSNVFSSKVITLQNATLHGDTVLLAGTSNGTFFMMNFDRGNIIEYHRQTVSPIYDPQPLLALHVDDNAEFLYVMTSKELHKLNLSRCSEYSSCSAVLEGRNPLCGWCLFQNSSTRREHCKGEVPIWISALRGECPYLTTDQTRIEVGNTKNTIKITVDGVALQNYNYIYECFFQSLNESTRANFVSSSVLQCSSPKTSEHVDETLWLRVNTGSTLVKLASLKLLFFRCDHYRKCGECVNLCSWCPGKAQCSSMSPDCNITEESACPRLVAGKKNIIPSSVLYPVNFTAENLNTNLSYQCRVLNVPQQNTIFEATVQGSNITCNCSLNVLADEGTVDYSIVIMYSVRGSNQAELDDASNTKVTVYDCNKLGRNCSYCRAFKNYSCLWNGGSCEYGSSSSLECLNLNVTEIVPDNAPHNVSIPVTLKGTDFGKSNSMFVVNLSGIDCGVMTTKKCNFPQSLPDVEGDLICQVNCKTGTINENSPYVMNPGPVSISRDGEIFQSSSVFFYYRIPMISDIKPRWGPRAGGTKITLSGTDLGVGSQEIYDRIQLVSKECLEVVFEPSLPINQSYEERMKSEKNYSIVCKTPALNINVSEVVIKTKDGPLCTYSLTPPFQFLKNPEVNQESLEKFTKGILSGGIHKTFTGNYLKSAQTVGVRGTHLGESLTTTTCYFGNDKEKQQQTAICPLPPVPETLRPAFKASTKRRRKRAADCVKNPACIQLQVFFDGFYENFTVMFVKDPSIYNFTEDKLIIGDNRTLIIYGQNINDVATEFDVNVTIGKSECRLLNLESNFLICEVPENEPDKANPDSPALEVKVKIGNRKYDVGYIAYIAYKKDLNLIITIAAAAGGGTLAIVVIVLVIAICKCRKIQKKANEYQKELAEIEMNIVKVVREEFLDMHTTMSTVNRNLVEQGFPYHSYQQYACNVMFSVDYLWTEPVMTDDERIRANKGMEQFESLIYNKFFLFSVISTLEKEKRFFIKEKSNFAGNLCAVLMGKMDYLEEIMKMLLSNHVQETPSKKQKTLFRRCESITEKLLSNWLSLCLYPHIKAHSSSPLYLLYVAIQKTMESGPIDAITHDAKYTLCEEKLLKKWSSTAEESGSQDIKFEAKTLTLNLVVDNGEEIFKCKVLDCDTISQVKSKCMAQIYVNFPASQLSVHPDELALEWHEGFGGALKLQDEDNTSKQDGHWLRLNTLAHYNVKDDSNMALVDPTCDGVKEEDYVNLTHVNIDVGSNGSFDSSEPLAPKDEENPNPLERWHLVKKEEETSKQGKSAIAELYLNRLLTTKQCVIEYVRTLWDTILDKNRCPPPVRFLFEYLDELGERGKVDPDTLHAWKSHSYAIRVWGSLMKMPALLFDIEIPGYMDDSLEVISQVFIESFSPDTQKVTKDSASWKLIFNNEVISLHDKVKDFYKNVKVDSQTPEEYRQYMEEVKRYQQETKFNKVSALYRLYKQIKPFIDDIVEDLSESQASSLQLDKKLEKVMEIMEAEEE